MYVDLLTRLLLIRKVVKPRYKRLTKFDEVKKLSKISAGKKNVQKKTLGHMELQNRIARHIAMNGEKSPFDITNDFGISIVLSINTFKKMLKRKYIYLTHSKKVSGGKREYHKLTEEGIRWILKEGNISFEEFWNLLFLIHIEEYDLKKIQQIEDLIKDFEIDNQINREYFFLYEHFSELAHIGKLVREEKMLNNREKFEKMFYKTVKPIFKNMILKKKQRIDEDILHELDFRRLINIVYDNKSKIKKNYLTPFGDMLLLYCYYDDAVNSSGKKFSPVKKLLEKKYPLVFDHWNLIKNTTGWTDTSLINCFLTLHVNGPEKIYKNHYRSMKFNALIGYDNDIELLKMFYFMQNRMKFPLKKEFDSATKIIQKWAQKENSSRVLLNYRKTPSKYIKILALANDVNFSKKDFRKILMESEKHNRNMLDYDDEINKKFKEKGEKNNLSRTVEEEQFLESYRSEPKPNTQSIKKIIKGIKPIIEYGKLYNFMLPRDPELYLSSSTSKFFSNKIFASLYNIISFQFYLVLKLGTSPKRWDELMNKKEMQYVKSWFNEWIKVITKYYSEIIHQIKEQKSETSQYSYLTNPVYLGTVLIPKYNMFSNNFKIKDV